MIDPVWLQFARKDIGLKEIKGPKTAAKISDWLVRLRAWWRDDETPWCGVAMAAWLDQAGFPRPKTYYRALDWLKWGADCGRPMHGAVGVLERAGGGHVGIVTGVSPDGHYVRILGGNQGDAVSEAWFDIFRFKGFRAPAGFALQLPIIAERGDMSRSEA